MIPNEKADELPPFEQLSEIVGFDTGRFVSINELIVAAGYHPSDYDRNSYRQWGGKYPAKGTPEWKLINLQWLAFRQVRDAAGQAT